VLSRIRIYFKLKYTSKNTIIFCNYIDMPGPYRRVPQELKEKILDAVKNDGIPVSQASREYGVSTPSIHSWLKKELEHT